MKKINLALITNILIAVWLLFWLNFAAFNWDVFIVKLNINLGYTLVGGRPFIVFFFTGIIILLIIRYLIFHQSINQRFSENDYKSSIALKDKEIEILKLKEMLFKMQSSDMQKTTADLNELHAKLDTISSQFNKEKPTENPPEDKQEKTEE